MRLKVYSESYINDNQIVMISGAGFIVRETSGLVRMALQAKDGRSSTKVQQGDYVDVQVPGVYILSLSRDELTLAACVSEGTVRFYDVPTLFKEVSFALRVYVRFSALELFLLGPARRLFKLGLVTSPTNVCKG